MPEHTRGLRHRVAPGDRNNLTILEEPRFEWLLEYRAEHEIEAIASLPSYLPDNITR